LRVRVSDPYEDGVIGGVGWGQDYGRRVLSEELSDGIAEM